MMITGYSSETALEVALQHDISMRTGEDSDNDFRRLLGNNNIVGSMNEHEALVILQGITNFLDLLVDGPCRCIVSSGYALVAELWEQYGQDIHQLTRDPREPYFLLQLLNQIDQEKYFLFRDLFTNIQTTGPGRYRMTIRDVYRRDEEINKMFENLKRNRTTDLKLPRNFLSLLEPKQQQKDHALSNLFGPAFDGPDDE